MSTIPASEDNNNPIRCAIVDDQPVFREGLSRLLDATPDIHVVRTAASAEEALCVLPEICPDVVLLRHRLPDRSGLDILPELLALVPGAAVVLVTAVSDPDLFLEAFRAGARGIVTDSCEVSGIIEEIRTVARGEVHLDAEVAARVVEEMRRLSSGVVRSLTLRETQILRLLTRGLSNCQIAAALGIQENTVKSHLSRLFEKAGVTDRLQAALLAVRLGLDGASPDERSAVPGFLPQATPPD